MRIDGVECAASNPTDSDTQWMLAIDGGFVRGNRNAQALKCSPDAWLPKASRMREILLICRIVVPETPKFGESLSQHDYCPRELVAYVDCNGERRFPMAGVTVMED